MSSRNWSILDGIKLHGLWRVQTILLPFDRANSAYSLARLHLNDAYGAKKWRIPACGLTLKVCVSIFP